METFCSSTCVRNKVCMILSVSVKLKLLGSSLTSRRLFDPHFLFSCFFLFVWFFHRLRKTFAWIVNLRSKMAHCTSPVVYGHFTATVNLNLQLFFSLSHFETNLSMWGNPGWMGNLVEFTVVIEIRNRDNCFNSRKPGRLSDGRIFWPWLAFFLLFTGLDGCYRATESVYLYT